MTATGQVVDVDYTKKINDSAVTLTFSTYAIVLVNSDGDSLWLTPDQMRFETSIDNSGARDTMIYIYVDSVNPGGWSDGLYGIAFGGNAFNTTEDAWIGGIFDGAAGSHYGMYFQVNDTISNFVQPVLLDANNKKFGGTLFKVNAGGSGNGVHISKTDTTAGVGIRVEEYAGGASLGGLFRSTTTGTALRVHQQDSTAAGVGLQLGDTLDGSQSVNARFMDGIFEILNDGINYHSIFKFVDPTTPDTAILGKDEYDTIWTVVNQVRTDSSLMLVSRNMSLIWLDRWSRATQRRRLSSPTKMGTTHLTSMRPLLATLKCTVM
jgi:hypothetical protein